MLDKYFAGEEKFTVEQKGIVVGSKNILIGKKGLRNLKTGKGRGIQYMGVISDDDDEEGLELGVRGQEYKGILKQRNLHHSKNAAGGGARNERTLGKNGFGVQAPRVAAECGDRPMTTINLHMGPPMPTADIDCERICYEINIVDQDLVGSQG